MLDLQKIVKLIKDKDKPPRFSAELCIFQLHLTGQYYLNYLTFVITKKAALEITTIN